MLKTGRKSFSSLLLRVFHSTNFFFTFLTVPFAPLIRPAQLSPASSFSLSSFGHFGHIPFLGFLTVPFWLCYLPALFAAFPSVFDNFPRVVSEFSFVLSFD